MTLVYVEMYGLQSPSYCHMTSSKEIKIKKHIKGDNIIISLYNVYLNLFNASKCGQEMPKLQPILSS